MSKRLQRLQHNYDKQSTRSDINFSILFAIVLALITENVDLSLWWVKKLLALFMLLVISSYMKASYLEDVYFSELIDRRQTNQPHYKTYEIIGDSSRKIFRKLLASWFGLGFVNTINNLIYLGAILLFLSLLFFQ